MAPEDKYRIETFTTESDEAVTTVNRLAIPFLSIPDLKSAFFLDDLLMVETESGTEGFTGLVNVTGDNYALHKVDRLGSIRTEDEGGNVQACYLDAGLNTLGKSDIPVVESAKVGNIKIYPALFKSAYFIESTQHGFQYFQEGAWLPWAAFGALAPAATSLMPFTAIRIPGFKAGDTVLIRSYIINSEGQYNSDNGSLLLELTSLTMRFSGSYASTAYNGTDERIVWTDFLPLGLSVYLYKTEQMDDIPAISPGYYVLDTTWYEVRQQTGTDKMEIVASGEAAQGSYPPGDPGNNYPPPSISKQGYKFATLGQGDQYENTCSVDHGGNAMLYLKDNENKWYLNYSPVTGEYTNLYTGYLMRGIDCVIEYYLNGVFQYEI